MSEEKESNFAKDFIKVQSSLVHVKRDTQGYGYKYAALDQCWDTIKKPLQDNGFSLIQLPYNEDNKIGIHSILLHKSREKIESKIAMVPVKNDPQTAGSLITYLRRYSLMSIVGLCPEDDDAKGAMPNAQNAHTYKKNAQNDTYVKAVDALNKAKNADDLEMICRRIVKSNFTPEQTSSLNKLSEKKLSEIIKEKV